MEVIAMDAHKRYSQVCVQSETGRILCEEKIVHDKRGRAQMALSTKQLPSETRYTLGCLLRELDMVDKQIQRIEKRMKKVFSKTRYGKLRSDVNHYLKWAYSEAGNSVAVNHKRFPVNYKEPNVKSFSQTAV
jgi:hypothetical protein